MSAPAGWYDDGTGQQRWWDGGAWGVYAQDVSSVPGGPWCGGLWAGGWFGRAACNELRNV
ncbi:DUF2510 domain-containing protein [Actinomyces sp. oral taxon 175]|uniref:DUF2510 domain-containing protein n=1 Tax=Actinomyces sp. oral taxon 175 TaxID=712119 RepID=UPI0020C820CC|nr:DUF2510 domain-containing protein [Actinomyces sp. oral taxon 175]